MDQLGVATWVAVVTLPVLSPWVLFEHNASWKAVVCSTLGMELCVGGVGNHGGLFSLEHFRVCSLQPRKVVVIVRVVDGYGFVSLSAVWIT